MVTEKSCPYKMGAETLPAAFHAGLTQVHFR